MDTRVNQNRVALQTMLLVSVLTAPAAAVTFNVLDYGAVGDGYTDDSAAILRAYAACASTSTAAEQHASTLVVEDGTVTQTVLFPTGHVYLAGPLKLGCNSSVTRIETGATIKSITNTDAWPFGPDCPEPAQGRTPKQMAPFLHIDAGYDVTITGGGIVDAQGEIWWEHGCGNWFCPPGYPHDQPKAFRPFLLRIDNSERVTVENITLQNPGFWNLVPVHSKDIAILGVNVTASWSAGAAKKDPFATPNTDGFEPMWSDNVTVRGCRVKNGDDCITIKSGSSNILVEDLYCEHGDGLTIGSVWYDDVTNVTYRRVVMNHTHNGPMIKGRSQGNATVSNILFEDVELIGVYLALTIDCVYETQGSVEKNIGVKATNVTFRNIHGTVTGKGHGGGGIGLQGDPSFLVDSAGSFVCLEHRRCSFQMDNVSISQFSRANTTVPAWLCNNTDLIASSTVNPPLSAKCMNE